MTHSAYGFDHAYTEELSMDEDGWKNRPAIRVAFRTNKGPVVLVC